MLQQGEAFFISGEKKTYLITVRLSADEKKTIDAAAKAAGATRSAWARKTLLSAATLLQSKLIVP